MVGMVVTTDWVTVVGVRMPGETPAPINVAVTLADPDHEGREQRQLADVRPYSGPELIPPPRKDVLEVGLEPTWQLAPERTTGGGRIKTGPHDLLTTQTTGMACASVLSPEAFGDSS